MRQHEERLRRLAMYDGPYLERVLCGDGADAETLVLEPRVRSLVRLAALIALDAPEAAFDSVTSAALANGATADDVVDVLITTCPVVGSAHVATAAPRVARVLGYDVDADLEGLDTAGRGTGG